MEKEDNPSKRKNISTCFDHKFSIDQRSQVIPAQKKTSKITKLETPVIPIQNASFEVSHPKFPVAAQDNISLELKYDYEKYMEHPNNSELIERISRNSDITYFEELLEKIVFDPKELNQLKNSTRDLSIGIIKPHQLKKLILKSYIRIFEELIEFIPFYFEQELNKKSIISNLADENREKDKLLEELGERINNIYLNLKERVQAYSNLDE